MNPEIASPHDKLFKQLLGERDNAISFLEHNLPGAILKHLDLSSLEVVHASFIDAQFAQSEAVVRILADMLSALGQPDFRERITRGLETLNELAHAPGFARYFEIFFRYVLQVHDIPGEDLMDLAIRTIKPDVRETIMTTYEQLRQEGRQEAASRILARQLSKRFQGNTEELTSLVAKLSFEQQEELSEKILEARSLDEIRNWLASVCQN